MSEQVSEALNKLPEPAKRGDPGNRTEFVKKYLREHGKEAKPKAVAAAYAEAGGTEELTAAYVSQIKLKFFASGPKKVAKKKKAKKPNGIRQPKVKKAAVQATTTQTFNEGPVQAWTINSTVTPIGSIDPVQLDRAFDALIADLEALGESANSLRFIRNKAVAKATEVAAWKPLA